MKTVKKVILAVVGVWAFIFLMMLGLALTTNMLLAGPH